MLTCKLFVLSTSLSEWVLSGTGAGSAFYLLFASSCALSSVALFDVIIIEGEVMSEFQFPFLLQLQLQLQFLFLPLPSNEHVNRQTMALNVATPCHAHTTMHAHKLHHNFVTMCCSCTFAVAAAISYAIAVSFWLAGWPHIWMSFESHMQQSFQLNYMFETALSALTTLTSISKALPLPLSHSLSFSLSLALANHKFNNL